MSGRVSISVLAVSLALMAVPALAQGGLGGGVGGGGLGHSRGGSGSGGAPSKPGPADRPYVAEKPTDQLDIIGVVTKLDPEHARVTIAYEAVEALDWPHGTMPFPVMRPGLLTGLKVGEKVRFKVDSHAISEIHPY